MQNPNFLVLDEPTNDLDIITLQILEQYLQDFRGCVIVVSHDRYFMDKVVDHLLVFHGEGDIKDFPGNYTQFREWEKLEPRPVQRDSAKSMSASEETRRNRDERKRRLSFKERQEFQQLELDIAQLEQEKAEIEAGLCGGTLDVEQITAMSKGFWLLMWIEICILK